MFAESSVAELAEASKHKPGQRIAQQKVASTSSATGKTAVHSKKKSADGSVCAFNIIFTKNYFFVSKNSLVLSASTRSSVKT